MYTRILTRVAYAACAIASFLPGAASASMVIRAQHFRPPAPVLGSPKVSVSGAVVSGDWIAVFDRSTGFEGGGQVMLYHHVGKQWDYAQTLSPPDAESCSDSMAMSGDLLFVSCPRAFDEERGVYMGVVVVYAQSGGQWQLAQTISSATGFYGNPGFGASLAVSGDRLFIGYTGYAAMSDALIYGDVEVFDISTLPASYVMQILPDMSVAYANFGSSLAATNGMLAVGANDANLAGIGDGAGAVYMFEQSGGDWVQRSMLTSAHPHAYDSFPSALAFQQAHLVAGSATNGAMDADGSLGAAFTYDGNGGSLSLADVLMPATSETDTFFGQSLASVGGTVFVGEPNGGAGGHVHVYNSSDSGWAHASSFVAPSLADGAQFGFGLSSDGKTLVVTALERTESGAGSVYVYDAPPTDQIFGDGTEP
ncbi:MAG TPA: hypothetical protein VH082_01340 [Rudaea sp.]|jgi:hypothetical protein|nr:hypothetical protein [Rudaea sp.]